MQNIIRIIKISKPLHNLLWIIGGLILLSSLLQLVAPVLSKYIVDEIVNRVNGGEGDASRLLLLISISFVMNLFGLMANTGSNRLGDTLSGKIRKFLTEKFYAKVLTLPQSYFDSEVSGKMLHQLTRGIFTIQDFLNTSTNFILPTLLQSLFTIIVLAYYNLPIAFFTFILFPIYLTISYYSTVKWGREEVLKNAIEDKNRGRLQEVVSNIALVKSFTQEKNEYEKSSKNMADSNVIYARQSNTYHRFDFFRGLSLNIILFIINIIVFYNTYQRVLTIGEMVLILQLVNQARIPLFAMSYLLTQIQRAEAGSKEYFEVLNLESVEDFRKSTPAKKIINPEITFKDVSFKYESSQNVLEGVNFTVKKGSTMALVGHSGAGKSTIVNLIMKFYIPTSGSISLNGKNYADIDYRNLRQNISLVFQDNELFSSTIKENVAYGKINATDKEVIQALKLANAYEFVMNLPKGIDSEVGERGVRLSGGQKQRIQIARAIIKDAPILILDEATSSLDAKSEKDVQDALENLMKNRLVIIIAHRFSTIQNVDNVIVLDKGVIAESGSPKELAQKPGLYRDLLEYQISGNRKLLEKYDLSE